eukprot:jgi/Galph1/4732/GphlegSOOS_G3345.1
MKFMKRKEETENTHSIGSHRGHILSVAAEGSDTVVIDETNISVLGTELKFNNFEGRSSFKQFNPKLESLLKELGSSQVYSGQEGIRKNFEEQENFTGGKIPPRKEELKRKKRKRNSGKAPSN